MLEVNNSFALINSYNTLFASLPEWGQNFFSVFILVLVIFIYSLLVWKFYKFIARKDLLELNLSQYNKSQHPSLTKLIAAGFYLLEYIIIVPFMVFFWYAIFTLFLSVLSETLNIGAILMISATIIGAIRIAAYYKEELAQEVAKLLPFTLLGVSILDYTKLFNVQRIVDSLYSLPDFAGKIFSYFAFIFLLEIVLRFFNFIFIAMGISEEDSKEED